MAHWIGFTYRQLYILTQIQSAEIYNLIPLDKMAAMYPGMHTLDEDMAGQIIVEGLCRQNR